MFEGNDRWLVRFPDDPCFLNCEVHCERCERIWKRNINKQVRKLMIWYDENHKEPQPTIKEDLR